jgi:hypothetical protein
MRDHLKPSGRRHEVGGTGNYRNLRWQGLAGVAERTSEATGLITTGVNQRRLTGPETILVPSTCYSWFRYQKGPRGKANAGSQPKSGGEPGGGRVRDYPTLPRGLKGLLTPLIWAGFFLAAE